jgi:hypothetical protein
MHIDQRHARFGQPPGQQTRLAKLRAAVALSHLRRFGGQVKSSPRGVRREQFEGPLLIVIERAVGRRVELAAAPVKPRK